MRQRGVLGRDFDGGIDIGFLRAIGVNGAVDHDLRRIDRAVTPGLCVGALAVGIARRGKGIFPAEIIPIIDRHRKRDDARIGGIFLQQQVGSRA